MYDPEIRLLLRWRKQILVWKAKEYGLETSGTKLELAAKIANFKKKNTLEYGEV